MGRDVGWTDWSVDSSNPQIQSKGREKDGFIHVLMATADESNPDANHVHIKQRVDRRGRTSGPEILCSVKASGWRDINRRRLVEKINDATGLNLDYRC